jgi:hypothetical protein
LKRHGIEKRVDVNTIANRTLISDETNGKIKDKAAAEYVSDGDILPTDARADLLEPHFIDDSTLSILHAALKSYRTPRWRISTAGSCRPAERR